MRDFVVEFRLKSSKRSEPEFHRVKGENKKEIEESLENILDVLGEETNYIKVHSLH